MAKKTIEIECLEAWRHISNYLDDAVDSSLRADLEAHFKTCAHCSAILDGTRNVVKLVGDGKTFDLPPKVRQRLYLKLDEHLNSRKR